MRLTVDIQQMDECDVTRVDHDGSSISRPTDSHGRRWSCVKLSDSHLVNFYVHFDTADAARRLATELVAAADFVESTP